MPGFLLHVGATINCMHGGTAQATVPNPMVKVSGQPIVTVPAPHAIVGCAFNVAGVPSPCLTGQWNEATAATCVFSNNMAVLLDASQANCIPNGTGLLITVTQKMVSGM